MVVALALVCVLPLTSSLLNGRAASRPSFGWGCRSPSLFFEVKFKYRNKPNYIELNPGRLWPPPLFRGAAFLSLLEGGVVSLCASPLVGGAAFLLFLWQVPLSLLPSLGRSCFPPLLLAGIAPSLPPWRLPFSSSFLVFPASSLGWCCSSASALGSSFGFVFSSVFSGFRVVFLFVFPVFFFFFFFFNFPSFHISFHVFFFILLSLFFVHFHNIFASYSNHCCHFHVFFPLLLHFLFF